MRILQGFAKEHDTDLNSDVGMDKGVKRWLQKITEKQNAANRELVEKEKQLAEMKLKIEQIEEQNQQELKERDQSIRFLASSLEKLHAELDSRNQERVNLEANLNRTAEKSLELEEKASDELFIDISWNLLNIRCYNYYVLIYLLQITI